MHTSCIWKHDLNINTPSASESKWCLKNKKLSVYTRTQMVILAGTYTELYAH